MNWCLTLYTHLKIHREVSVPSQPEEPRFSSTQAANKYIQTLDSHTNKVSQNIRERASSILTHKIPKKDLKQLNRIEI